MGFGKPVQPVDAWIPTGQSFFQMRPRSHVLITGPMKFHARRVFESFTRFLSDVTANGFLEGSSSFFGCLPRFLTVLSGKGELLGQLGSTQCE